MACSIELKVKDMIPGFLDKLDQKVDNFLEEVKNSIASQASANSPVDTGALSRSFLSDSYVDSGTKTAFIGSKLEYSVYQEFGTGEYAVDKDGNSLGGQGRGGVRPKRMLYTAMKTKEPTIKYWARQTLGGG